MPPMDSFEVDNKKHESSRWSFFTNSVKSAYKKLIHIYISYFEDEKRRTYTSCQGENHTLLGK